jgi:hypothetical protein
MNKSELGNITLSSLYQTLQDRHNVIVDRWRNALAGTSFTPLTVVQTCSRLGELTDRVISLLVSETLDRREARKIGAALAHMRYLSPEALGKTQEVLGKRLLEDLPPQGVAVLQRRLATLLAEIGAGFFEQARNETAEQLTHLQKLRCELAQGNYFAKPLTGEAASALIAAGN